MQIWDRIILLLTGLIAIYMIGCFSKQQKTTSASYNIYYIVSFTVLLVAGLLLIVKGWGLLSVGSNAVGTDLTKNLIAIVSTIIPFSLAIGLVSQYKPAAAKGYMVLMVTGFVLIALTRFGVMPGLSKIVYPMFHAIAGLTIFLLPVQVALSGEAKQGFFLTGIGGALIGVGGIALGFLMVGKQLLFFSAGFVLKILAPLLFLTALFMALGFLKNGVQSCFAKS